MLLHFEWIFLSKLCITNIKINSDKKPIFLYKIFVRQMISGHQQNHFSEEAKLF